MNKIVVFLLLISCVLKSQNIHFPALEKEIIHNNQLGKHDQSQKVLLEILDNKNITLKDEVSVNFLLASTFRSLNDYPTTVKYLEKSMELAKDLPETEDSLRMHIKSEMAFNYFDHHKYAESDRIMQDIIKLNFRNLDPVDKAYIIMQIAYLKYLKKDFSVSERMYEESLSILKQVSPCNQPVVLVKKMQLYGELNKMDSVSNIYERCVAIAGQCSILKYKIYATEELLEIYKKRGNAAKVFQYVKILDSLRNIDNREAKLSKMQIDNQKDLKKEDVEEEEGFFWKSILLEVSAVCLLIAGFIFYRKSRKYKKEKSDMSANLQEIQENQVPVYENHAEGQIDTDLHENKLTDRQKELLELMAKGLSNKEIAEKLFISENTVKYHIKNIYLALGLKDRKELFLKIASKNK
ncbi:LuxR C-terminal-related transcriptional regulator [uncultured Chryseobacterium sp.]|uniref:LuxR C-terminal-related transcriptional regulator n=1 Tax=uncultured Chryseobacterium sp. TaxID=259322 RepID=UPI0025DB24D8|nr:LuxR C-terminal-related transcriptional regulator [uncultured Chryseobacterium sp.]